MPQLRYVRSPSDLVTPIDVTQSGFLQQALRKTKEASPYVDQARNLLSKLQRARAPQELVGFSDIRDDLVTAAGFSDKAAGYFTPSELEKALLEVLKEIEQKTGSEWRAEIAYRFLLTRGDTLGGVMRNIMGTEAKVKFVDAILAALRGSESRSHGGARMCHHMDKPRRQRLELPWSVLNPGTPVISEGMSDPSIGPQQIPRTKTGQRQLTV